MRIKTTLHCAGPGGKTHIPSAGYLNFTFYKKQFILFFVHNTHKTIDIVCTKITSKTHIYILFIYYIYTAQKFSKLSIFASELIIF